MPKTIHEERAALHEAERSLTSALDGGEGDLAALTQAVESAEARVKALEAAERARASVEVTPGRLGEPDNSLADAIGTLALEAAEQRQPRAIHLGAAMGAVAERALSTSTDADLVPGDVAGDFLTAYRMASGLVAMSNIHVTPQGAQHLVVPTITEVNLSQTAEGTAASESTATVAGAAVSESRYVSFFDVSFALIQSSPLQVVEAIANRLLNGAGLATEALIVDAVTETASNATAVNTAGSATTAELFARYNALAAFRTQGSPERPSRAAWVFSKGAYSAVADDVVGSSDARPIYADSWAQRPAGMLFGLPVWVAERKGTSAYSDDLTGSTDVPITVVDCADVFAGGHEPVLTIDGLSRAVQGETRVTINVQLGAQLAVSDAAQSLKGA